MNDEKKPPYRYYETLAAILAYHMAVGSYSNPSNMWPIVALKGIEYVIPTFTILRLVFEHGLVRGEIEGTGWEEYGYKQ